MRIFDVGNKAKAGFWCAAPDEDTAKDIALAANHGKSRGGLRVTDVTEGFLANDPKHHDMDSIHAILNGTATGQVTGLIATRTFAQIMQMAATDVVAAPTKTRWVVNGNR